MLTVNVGQRSVVLIFDEHVAEIDLGGVHVLPGDDKLQSVPSLTRPMGQYIPDLGGEDGREHW